MAKFDIVSIEDKTKELLENELHPKSWTEKI